MIRCAVRSRSCVVLPLRLLSTQASPRPPASHQPPSGGQPAAGSAKPSLKALITQHGAAAVVVYGTINLAGFLTLYAAIKAGLVDTARLVQLLVEHTPVERWSGLEHPIYANVSVAYACNILLEPVRLFGTLVFAPRASRWWKARSVTTK